MARLDDSADSRVRAWDRQAHAAEQESKLLSKKFRGKLIPDAAAQKRARELREKADEQFQAAMDEMQGLVNAALRKPVRKPRE